MQFLKKTQSADGSWPGSVVGAAVPKVGFTALAALTLLECKVPPDDPGIRNAAEFVRDNVDNASDRETYQLSLAILFLDRLGKPRDDAIIQRTALRVMTGQNLAGGWTYRSGPRLAPPEMKQLFAFLKSRRPSAPCAAKAEGQDGAVNGAANTSPPIAVQKLLPGLQQLPLVKLHVDKGALTARYCRAVRTTPTRSSR